MSGKSGIGTYIDSMLPSFKESGNEFFFIENTCGIKPFSLREMFFFPKDLLNKINSCDAFFTPYCNIPGRIFSRGIKVPVFCTIHDIIFLDMPELAGRTGTAIRRFFYQRAINKSRLVFTVSQFSRNRILEKLHCKKNITVVYSGVPLYNESPAQKTRKTDNIIFVGNIKKHKGLATLIPAFIKFRRGAPEAKLLIVGSKDNFRTSDEEMQKMIAGAEKDGIEFTGFIPDERLKELISSARLLVQPSLYEGFGVPPLQALYSGTKAVISDIPVFKEIYKNLPVTFFKVGDSEDLTQKLSQVYSDKSRLPEFDHIYSYKNSANLILKTIEKTVIIKK